jgi:mRNA-degrading endonuclease toxin of MazEF toxin-antitoxin module
MQMTSGEISPRSGRLPVHREPLPARGEVWWCKLAEIGRRPVVVLSRDVAIPRLRRTLIGPLRRRSAESRARYRSSRAMTRSPARQSSTSIQSRACRSELSWSVLADSATTECIRSAKRWRSPRAASPDTTFVAVPLTTASSVETKLQIGYNLRLFGVGIGPGGTAGTFIGAVRDSGTATGQSTVTAFGNEDEGRPDGTVTLVGRLGTITEEFSGIAGPWALRIRPPAERSESSAVRGRMRTCTGKARFSQWPISPRTRRFARTTARPTDQQD